jgi:hypothetical protein
MEWSDVPTTIKQMYPAYLPQAEYALAHDWSGIFTDELGYVPLKQASALQPVADALDWPQKFLGGPTPLTSMLLGGALGAGLGYAGGLAGEKLLPGYLEPGKARKRLAMLGGAVGAGLPAYFLGRPALQLDGWKGLLMPHAQGKPNRFPAELDTQVDVNDPVFKIAADAGGAFAPQINVDAFNQVVLGDPHTPWPIRAATTGLLESTALTERSESVSPMAIARTAIGLGASVGTGLLIGRTIGMLAGANPGTQKTLQRTGMLAGLLVNVIPKLF